MTETRLRLDPWWMYSFGYAAGLLMASSRRPPQSVLIVAAFVGVVSSLVLAVKLWRHVVPRIRPFPWRIRVERIGP